jgi:rubrerythrin
MDSKKEALADGLKKAIQAEQYGHSFYLMAANSTDDPKGKEVFQTLAGEELDHVNFLTAHYRSVMETGLPSADAALGRQHDLSEAWPIFSEGLKDRIGSAKFEMTSLSIGIQLEQDAMNFYSAQAEAADDPVVRKMFEFLSKWEAGHYHALLKQYELLKEDYWSAGGFAPF